MGGREAKVVGTMGRSVMSYVTEEREEHKSSLREGCTVLCPEIICRQFRLSCFLALDLKSIPARLNKDCRRVPCEISTCWNAKRTQW